MSIFASSDNRRALAAAQAPPATPPTIIIRCFSAIFQSFPLEFIYLLQFFRMHSINPGSRGLAIL
jgi:hypothetical protein